LATPPSSAPPARGATPRKAGAAKSKGNRRKWVIVATIAVLVIAAVGWWQYRKRAAAALAAQPTGRVVEVALSDVQQSVESSGKVEANLEVDIKCRASGEIIKLPFDVSETVKKGDLLCQLDPTDEELAVRSAEAALSQAKARLAQAQSNLRKSELALATTRMRNEAALASAKVRAANAKAKADRQAQLVTAELGSQQDLETAQTDAAAALAEQRAAEVAIEELKQQEIDLEYQRQAVAMAEAELLTSQIALDTQKQQLAYTTVYSPMDGTVSDLQVQLGTIVASGTNAVNGGTTILTLADLSRVFVMATVDESDIGGVRVDQPARITVDSFPGRVFEGKVVRVAVKGVNESNVVTFEAKVEVLDAAKDLLKPAMTGNVTIIQKDRNDVVAVPTNAVALRGGKAYVTMEDGSEREVVVGVEGIDTYEITSGLAAGEKIRVSESEVPSIWRNAGGGKPQ
jgi:HlyD family secretion protein